MTRMRHSLARHLRLLAPILVLMLSLLIITRCQLPEGCGPGLTTMSPYVGNLVDYTDPPSGMILAKTDFTTLTIYFFVPVDASTFDPASHIRVFEIDDRWEAVDAGREWTEHEVFGVFSANFEYSCQDHPVCDPADPRHQDTFATKFVLNVAVPELLQIDKSYRIEILGECSEDPPDPTACSTSPLLSWDGAGLITNVNIIIGLIEPTPGSPDCLTMINYPLFSESYFTRPHQKIQFMFNRPLGFINFDPDPQEGFYFGLRNEGRWLESDSIQGLSPGTQYKINFLSSDQM